MAETYRIVAARAEQLASIPGIEHAAATLFSEADLPAGIRYLVTDQETLSEARRENRLWLAVKQDDVPVGFAYLTEMDGQAHLDELDVHPDHARRGIGTRLLDAARHFARGKGYVRLTLVTFSHLSFNAPFYAKRGFDYLAEDAIGDDIRHQLAEEAAAGMDVSRRVVMQQLL